MQQQVEQQLRELSYLIQYNPNTVIITNRQGEIEYVNAVFTSITGYQPTEVVGQHIDQINLDDLSSTTMAYSWQAILEGDVWEGELTSIKKDGSLFPEQVFLLPISDEENKVYSVAFIKRDISDQKKVERDLLDLTDTLEQRVNNRTDKLDRANQELLDTLDQLTKMQAHLIQSEKMSSLGELIAGIAHEINTPVGIAYTASTHLEKTVKDLYKIFVGGGLKKSDLLDFMETCLESTRLLTSNLNRASELIRSFKKVAIDQSGEAKRDFKLRSYIEEILLSLRPVLKKTDHQVRVAGDRDFVLSSQPGVFSQVLTNLITNSVIHGYDEGETGVLEISFTSDEKHLYLVFSDDGRGISEDDMANIFSPFFTTSRESGGSGLGLHIIFNIITQQLHGTINCESSLGQGTSFNITIPIG